MDIKLKIYKRGKIKESELDITNINSGFKQLPITFTKIKQEQINPKDIKQFTLDFQPIKEISYKSINFTSSTINLPNMNLLQESMNLSQESMNLSQESASLLTTINPSYQLIKPINVNPILSKPFKNIHTIIKSPVIEQIYIPDKKIEISLTNFDSMGDTYKFD